jgi:hypothetical protein
MVMFIKKKWLILIVILAIIGVTAVNSFATSSQDFDGLFTMDVPIGQHYRDVTWCHSNKPLGCAIQYWYDDPNGLIDKDEFAVYYYDNSQLWSGESNAWEHAVNVLTTSFVYNVYQTDGGFLVLHNDIDMSNLPEYLVGVTNDDGSKVVFVGGYDLNMLKSYASSVQF